MEFRILGPLEAVSNGQTLDLGGAKQRTLLAMLLLHANTVVSTDRLIDALWEDDPPESAQKALQVHVSNLRKLLGKERVQTKAPGYVLTVEGHELDLARFLDLQKHGSLAEALALWRGPPLPDFAYQRFAQAEIARLEELRLTCLEERIERDLQDGRHAELTSELEALVKLHPLRERLRAQLMFSLYRSGRQAETLEGYQAARATLVEELGIEPGRELRELHQQILNQDARLDLPVDSVEAPEPGDSGQGVAAPSAGWEPDHETRKTVTVVCASVTTTTAEGGQLDPEALRRVMRRGFAELQAAVQRHGGSVEAVSGRTLSAIFGIPVVHEDDALRALRSTVEASAALRELAEELRAQRVLTEVRIGVSTGEVVVGGLLQPTGEPVTAAHSLAQLADDGQTLLDGTTYRLVRHAVDVDPKGDAFELVGILPADVASGRRSPMVGRIRERNRLQHAFEQAVGDRSCQLFTVLGSAGVGKSRLVQEFLGELQSQALVARGRCLPYGEGVTYWPLLEAVKDAIGLEDDDSPDEAKSKLVNALSDEQAPELLAQQIAETIGLAEATTGIEEAFTAVRTLFEALARAQPLVLVFDDIHCGESTFLDLLEHLAEWTREVPILQICLARPELLDVRPGWAGGKLNATSILLEPLSPAESVELIENLASVELDEATQRRIAEAAEGNPLFVEEMLALALEAGLPAGEIVVPPTIQTLLAARLDRLAWEERAVLDRASVQGNVFYQEAVIALSPPELSPVVSASLGSLLRKELVRPERTSFGGRTYRFRHLLIRDSAYESIPKEARSEMHEGFARWLEGAAGEGATAYDEIVGYHLEQAYRYRAELGPADDSARTIAAEAAARLGAAGRRAFVRSDTPAGVNLISRAVDLLPPEDPLRVDLIPNVRVVQGMRGDMSWAERVLTEAVEAAATTGDRGFAAHALVQRGFLRLFTERDVTREELVETAERAIAVFEELSDELGLARSWRLIAQAHYLGRSAGSSEEACERALEHARRAGDSFEEQETIQWWSVVLFLGPKHAAEAGVICKRLLEQSAGRPSLEVHVLNALSYLMAIQGLTEEAKRLAGQCHRLMNDLAEGWYFPAFAGFLALWELDPAATERELRPQYELLKRVGERSHFSTVASLLSRVAYAQGRYERAEELTRECEEAARPNDVESQIHWRSTRAKVFGRRGELDAAEKLAREAVAIGEASDFLSSHGDALTDLAEVLELAGRRGEAADAVREAIPLYERKGNALSAARARERLAELEE